MKQDEYELRKELIEFRHTLKDFNKSGWLYKLGDRFCTWLENKLRKAQEKWKTITHYPLLLYAD